MGGLRVESVRALASPDTAAVRGDEGSRSCSRDSLLVAPLVSPVYEFGRCWGDTVTGVKIDSTTPSRNIANRTRQSGQVMKCCIDIYIPVSSLDSISEEAREDSTSSGRLFEGWKAWMA